MIQSTTPRRRPRRTGIIRSLLGYLRPFQSERWTLRAAMTIDDWKTLASERGAALVEARREADQMAVEIRTLRRAVSLADEGKRIAEAGMRHADGERDDAQRISAKWEIEAADLRDRLVEAQREIEQYRSALLLHPCGKCTCAGEGQCAWCQISAAKERAEDAEEQARDWKGAAATAANYIEAGLHKAALNRLLGAFGEQARPYAAGETDPEARATEALALLDSERAAWREERAQMVRERHDLANRVQAATWQGVKLEKALQAHRRCFEREASTVVSRVRFEDWQAAGKLLDDEDEDPRSAGPGGADLLAEVAPGTPEFKAGALLYRQPDGTVSPVPPPPPAAPEVQVRTVLINRVPDMRPRGTGEGGSANAFTATVPAGEGEG